MTTQTRKATAVLGGSVVLAFAAYAVGSQAGGGGAVADGSVASASDRSGRAGSSAALVHGGGRGDRGRHGPGLSMLADRFGVSATALRDALSEIRAAAPSREQRRTRLAAALAAALDLPADKVGAALDRALPDHDARHGAFADELARELGVDAAKVRAALDSLHDRRDGRRGDRRAGPAALAAEIGVSQDRLRAALGRLHDARHDRRGGGDRRDALATALGVTEDRLETALDKIRSDARDAFATQLARKLSISPDKVKDVLADLPRRRWRHG